MGALSAKLSVLTARTAADQDWVAEHPEAARRAQAIVGELGKLNRAIENRRRTLEGREPVGALQRQLAERERGLSRAERARRQLDGRHHEPPDLSHGMELSL